MTMLDEATRGNGSEPTVYVQTPPTVEALRSKLAELRRVLDLNPEENVEKLLRENLEATRNLLAAMRLEDNREVWDRYRRMVSEAAAGVPPRGLLTREALDDLLSV